MTIYVYNKKLINDVVAASVPAKGSLSFGSKNRAYQWKNWSTNQEGYRWTDGKNPAIQLSPQTNWKTAKFVLYASSFQPLKGTLSANGIIISKLDLAAGVHEIVFSVKNKVSDKSILNFEFNFEHVKSPRDMDMNDDPRKLGLQVRRLDYSFQ